MFAEVVSPYFCFYTGSLLVGKLKEEAVKVGDNDKKAIIADFCSAVDTKALNARKTLMDKTLHGDPCIDVYQSTYSTNEMATKFDPISRELTSRAMCAEFVKMINKLLDKNKANLTTALKYSYLISQQVDLQTQ